MTPFKERMNLYRAYRELNPDKNYWDWKASMYVQDNDWGYLEWKRNLPENLRYESPDYDLYGAYKAGMQPVLESDGTYHLGSRDPQTGRILKRKGHPTYLMAIDAEKAAGYDVYEGDDGEMYSKAPLPNEDISGWLEFKDYYNSNELGAKERQQLRSWYRRRKAYAERTGNVELLEQLKDDEPIMRRLFGDTKSYESKYYAGGRYHTNVNLDDVPVDIVSPSYREVIGLYTPPRRAYPKGLIEISGNNLTNTTLLHEYAHVLNNDYYVQKKIADIVDLYGGLLYYDVLPDPEYWTDPAEIHSRLQELRHTHGISPLQKVTKDDLKKMRKSGKSQHAILDYFADDDLILDLLNRVADAGKVQPATNSVKTDILTTQFGGVIPAMTDGGENKLLPDPAESYVDEYGIIHRNRYANGTPYEQGLELDPVADVFNPMNDVYDVVQIGKDATEGNWAGVGAGLALAMMPKWMEKVGGAVKSGVKKLINKARNRDNVDWDEVVSGLAVPVKKDPTGIDAKPISDEIKVDDTHVAGLSGETAPRYIDYGNLEYRDHIGYTRPQWLKDVLEFYNTDVAAREKNIATKLGRFYNEPYDRSSMTLYSAHPTNVRLYLDDVNFAGYVHNDGIVIAKDSKLSPFLVMAHESGHIDQIDAYNSGVNYLGVWHDNEIDPIIPLTRSQFVVDNGSPILTTEYIPEVKNVLDDAYQFTEEYLEKHPGIARSLEAGSTNRENRADLWLAASKPSPAELDNIIDNMTDDDVLYLLSQGNGYSRDFYRSIKLRVENGANLHELVEKVKYAMKYIPAFAAPMALAVPQMTNETKDKSN